MWYNPIRLKEWQSDYPLIASYEALHLAEVECGERIMWFRMIYQGPLFAEAPDSDKESRRIHKHEIRRVFHRQLLELWNTHSRLNIFKSQKIEFFDPVDRLNWESTRLDNLVKRYKGCGVNWVPLVNDEWGVACRIDILFLRRESKGGILQSGDLDNRIKTLFDALRIPKESEWPSGIEAAIEPNPFFCLLSDDALVAEFSVTSDRLLVPPDDPLPELLPAKAETKGSSSTVNKVYLVLEVKTFIIDPEKADATFGRTIHS